MNSQNLITHSNCAMVLIGATPPHLVCRWRLWLVSPRYSPNPQYYCFQLVVGLTVLFYSMILSQPHASNFCGYLARNDNICMDHTFPNNPAKKIVCEHDRQGRQVDNGGGVFHAFFLHEIASIQWSTHFGNVKRNSSGSLRRIGKGSGSFFICLLICPGLCRIS